MQIPPYLNKGDTIAIAAPARSISYEQLRLAKAWVESKGFNIFIPNDLYISENQMGGSDQHRAALFNDLLSRKDVKAIWCARGGYGCLRMVDGIDISILKNNPKWIIGFSDITVIHSHVLKNCNLAVLHATMPIFMDNKLDKDYEDVGLAIDSMLDVISGKSYKFNLIPNEIIHSSFFDGEIVGGNLSVLMSIIDSNSEINFDDRILFIEDLDEYYYHIDRILLMLKRSGRLSKLKALLVGSFTNMHDHTIPFGQDVKSIIMQHCAGYGYPIIFDLEVGHHLKNIAIPFGVPISFRDGILTFASA
ncbi:MAG: LD-carboxypeptidase [bacterium]|nr:LD-carboxypeptidase [bacterium]